MINQSPPVVVHPGSNVQPSPKIYPKSKSQSVPNNIHPELHVHPSPIIHSTPGIPSHLKVNKPQSAPHEKLER